MIYFHYFLRISVTGHVGVGIYIPSLFTPKCQTGFINDCYNANN